ncbi:IS630 family transposase [Sporolactobacillus sp. THM19-2]|uniref:IS630 family transposase n=1 Tax=Sporolactobacillus sp. THM19-2 TaxID=2511171 RepID=UPI001F116D9B|nr:IS630 family transposase [Sporolactobacillus sp. THM19-2]
MQDAEFVAHMKDVLDIYSRPYDPQKPLICLNEKPCMMHADKVQPLPIRNKSPRKTDYEYERRGSCSIFGIIELLTGKQYVDIRPTRTAIDFAEGVHHLVDDWYPQAEKIVLVMDNLNTHRIGSLYKKYPLAEAKRILDKLDIHYTPKHGSWLNIAEIGLNLFSKQCLNRRIPTIEELDRELNAWCEDRNHQSIAVKWPFTTADARTKLGSLYPELTVVN